MGFRSQIDQFESRSSLLLDLHKSRKLRLLGVLDSSLSPGGNMKVLRAISILGAASLLNVGLVPLRAE